MKTNNLLISLMMAALVLPAFAEDDYWYPVAGSAADRILVPGQPPLTVGQQNAFLNCLELGLSVALTQEEQEAARAALMEEYLSHKMELLDSLRETRKLWDESGNSNPESRGKIRRIIRDSLLEETQKFPDLGMSKVLRKILKDANDAVIPGSPRIDRRAFSAFFELIQMCLRLRDKRVVTWDERKRIGLESQLLQRIPGLSPEGRKWLANADFHRSMISRNWREISADEKETIRKFLIETFAPQAEGEESGVNLDLIPIPPPTIFQLPTDLPWEFR